MSNWPEGFKRVPDEEWAQLPLEELALKYDSVENHGWYDNLDLSVEQLVESFNPGETLIDYSGGTGILVSRLLEKLGPQADIKILIVDSSPKFLRIAYEKFPQYPESVFNMGLTHFRNKDFSEAVSYFNKTIEINPDHKNALTAIKNVAKNFFNKGNQLYKRGDLEGALASYDEVLRVDKTFYQAHFQVGVIQSKMGDKDKAILTYEKSIDINPQFYKAYFALGLAKNSMNNSDGALQALQSAIDINPSYDKAYGAMGDIYIQQKDYDKAKQTLKMATTVNPNYSKGYANLGVIYSEEEEWNQAISSLEMAVALNERDAMSYFRLSGAHNMNGDCKSALEAARKSTELKNRFGGAWFELGTAEWCSGSGNKAGALNAFEKARNDRSWRKMAEYEIDKIKNPQKYIK